MRFETCRPSIAGERLDVKAQVGLRQQAFGLLGPFGKLQPSAREQVAKAGVFPFLRVVEAVEIGAPSR